MALCFDEPTCLNCGATDYANPLRRTPAFSSEPHKGTSSNAVPTYDSFEYRRNGYYGEIHMIIEYMVDRMAYAGRTVRAYAQSVFLYTFTDRKTTLERVERRVRKSFRQEHGYDIEGVSDRLHG